MLLNWKVVRLSIVFLCDFIKCVVVWVVYLLGECWESFYFFYGCLVREEKNIKICLYILISEWICFLKKYIYIFIIFLGEKKLYSMSFEWLVFNKVFIKIFYFILC